MKIHGQRIRTKVPPVALTQERLKEAVKYDPDTGVFVWVKCHAGITRGRTAGNKSHGYIRISIDGYSYLAHRLAWLYVHGEFPNSDIDHINGARSDNRLSNLRTATRSQNLMNSKNRARVGCYFHKQRKKWHARISANGKDVSLGYYKTKKLAAAAYLRAIPIHHGKFARTQP